MQATSHDPYRSAILNVPQLDLDHLDEVDGPVRIMAFVDRYPPWINAGAEWMLHSIFRRLVERGHQVSVVCPIPQHVELPSMPTIVDGVHVYDENTEPDIADKVAAVSDVLVGQLLYTRGQVQLASKLDLPLIYVLHNDSQLQHWNLTPNNVTVLAPNSEWIQATLDTWDGPSFVCRPPVFCADYAVDSDAARQYITLVNLIPEKGVSTFYEMARLRYREPFLAVTGAYGHQHRPQRGYDNVQLLSPTSNIRDDVYAKTRVPMMPSWYESWGRVAVEAMAAGCPVIAAPTPGLVEALGDAAQFVDPLDISGWVEALGRLDDPIEWKLWQSRGRDRAAELERLTDGDLDEFERWVRRCAAIPPKVTDGPERPLSGPETASLISGG